MDEHAKILARRLLADEFVEALRPQRRVGILGGALGSRDAGRVGCHPPLIRRCMAPRQAVKRGLKRMEFDRRTMLAGTAAAMMAAPALAKGKAAAGSWYDRAIIIDALGGLSDPYAPNDQLRLSDRVWSEMLATGVNVVRDTVMPVGNGTDPWGDFQKDLQGKKDVLN